MTPTLEVYEGRRALFQRKQWRWRIIAGNGRVIANGGEGYNNRADLLKALGIVRDALARRPYEAPTITDLGKRAKEL